MGWFGSLDLAYKYALVFGIALALTIAAGVIKVLYDRNKLKKFAKDQQNVESGKREDQLELNQREKDEGDLFGIRAIEAGFYAGIPQSRPTSRAGSVVETPSMSSNTLIGSFASPKIQLQSASSSVTSLPLAHTNNRDSGTLPRSNSPPRRTSPPAIKLRPSEAEMNGRINHGAEVNMNPRVPPSPTRPSRSPAFGGSDDESDGHDSPRSLSPGLDSYKPDHYAPVPPRIPMPEALSISVHAPEVTSKSQTASFNESSPGHSPGHGAPSSPGYPPETRIPTMPAKAMREEPRSIFPAYTEQRRAPPSGAGYGYSNNEEPQRPASPIRLLPNTYKPSHHQRDASDASSVYSQNRISTHSHQHKNSKSTDSTFSYNYSFPESSNQNSIATGSKEQSRHPSISSSLQAPGSSTSNQHSDPRFSEFYDAYYRHSQLGVAQKTEVPKRPNQLNTQPTIIEVPSPMASLMPQKPSNGYGMAL